MHKSSHKNQHRRDKTLNLPRISLPSSIRQIQLSMPKKSTTQSIHSHPFEVSAKSWVLYHINQNKVLAQHRSRLKRQMASLTKIMTAICVIQICSKFKINIDSAVFRITQSATNIKGTSANLITFQWISITDCLYALMLPSGNDAALVLAENLGAILLFEKIGQLKDVIYINSLDLTSDQQSFDLYVQEFVDYMNSKGIQFGMKGTCFNNPHGLDNHGHYSTCEDILLLTSIFLQNEFLCDIVNTKCYIGELKSFKNKQIQKRRVYWMNTNKLLGNKGCKGVKTGFTHRAGGCLSTLYESNGQRFIVVVVGCKTSQNRFQDTLKLLNWIGKTFRFAINQE